MINILVQVFQDLAEPIQYLPMGLVVASIILFILALNDRRSLYRPKTWATALLCLYLTIVLFYAFFSREPGSRTSVDLVPFSTWGATAKAKAFVLENILMFIPMGWLLPKVFGRLRTWQLCIFAGFVFSFGLELAQFLTGRGYCQTDDVIMNTLGTGIGWLLSYRYSTKGK